MNFLKKDKYRTKIIEHLLHQCGNQEINSIDQNHEKIKLYEDFTADNHKSVKFCSSIRLKKNQKKKALISDSISESEETEQKSTRKVVKSQFFDMNDHHNTKSLKLQISQSKKKSANPKEQNKQNIKMNQIQPRGHMRKQKYTYHQKLPIMQVSQDYDKQILQKLKRKSKNQIVEQNKQNYPKNQNKSKCEQKLNHELRVPKEKDEINKKSQGKQKKYRFIPSSKVLQAKMTKRQIQFQDYLQKQPTAKETGLQNLAKTQNKLIGQSQRSQGSKQMIQFLESAREKLFINLQQSQPARQQSHTFQEGQFSSKDMNTQPLAKHDNSPDGFSFKIQIQISSDRTCEIDLSLNSNPRQIAKNFVQLNRKQLTCFKDLQQVKLEDLLAERISLQIQKQRKIQNQKKQTLIQAKYRKIISQMGVNELLLKEEDFDFNCQPKIVNNLKLKNNQTKNTQRNTTKQQFSHVYIENIDSLPSNKDLFDSDKKQKKKKEISNKLEQKQQKIIVSDKSNNKKLRYNDVQEPFNEFSKDQFSMRGYFNSPHELITYRQNSKESESPCQTDKIQNSSKNINDFYDLVSHFPLSKSTAQFRSIKKYGNQKTENHEVQKQQSLKTQEKQNEDIGAIKILAKSRQKPKRINELCQNKQTFTQNTVQIRQSGQFLNKKEIQLQRKAQQPTFTAINPVSEEIVTRLGKQNILSSLKVKQQAKRQQIIKENQVRQKQKMRQCSFKPKINNLSKEIDENKNKKMRIGTLLEIQQSKKTDNTQKMNRFGNQGSQQQIYEGQNAFFISNNTSNLISSVQTSDNYNSIMSKLKNTPNTSHKSDRYKKLYENHKTIQAKKQCVRQKSIEQISFRPQINSISKKIVQTKRNSLNNSTCHQAYNESSKSLSRHQSTCKKPRSKRNSVHSNQLIGQQIDLKPYHQKRKSLNFSRNLQGLQIGQYLYKEAMRMKKKKQSMGNGRVQNFKPLQKSQKIMENLKEKKLTQYFYMLLNVEIAQSQEFDQDIALQGSDIDLLQERFQSEPLKYLIPLLSEIKELNVSLTREQFVDAGLKLLICLSQDEKYDLLSKKPCRQGQSRQNEQTLMNKYSRQIIEKKQYCLQDIYHRGLMYKKQIKDKVDLSMEDKVRKQLSKCTFKPKINAEFQTIQ